MKPIILLSGPVGAGKSTVARELVAISPSPIACIEGDTFWSFIKGPAGGPVPKNFKMIMTSMVSAAISYALYGYEVIVDFSVPPWFLDTARKVVSRREVPLDYVVLRPSESVCAARAADRSEGTVADYTRYAELYRDFDEAQQYTIQDDRASAAELAARIREGLDAGKFRLSNPGS
jgi:adenylate kinase family enzyme